MTTNVKVVNATDAEILAALTDFIGDRPSGDVVHDLWHGGKPDPALTAMLPAEQIAIVSLADRLRLSDARAIVLLATALRKTASWDGWIHYALAKHLSALVETGIAQAKMPAIIHALLAVEGLKDHAPSAIVLPLAVLARGFSNFSPREAIRAGLLSARHGQVLPLPDAALSALDLPSAPRPPTIPEALQISRALKLDPAATVHRVTSLATSAGRQSVEVTPPARVTLPVARGDASHYIFSPAGQALNLPGITVHTIPNGTFSIDAVSPGLEQHYFFDQRGDCVLDYANGTAPFIAETILEYEEPVAILDDCYSGTMNICHFLLDRLTRVPIYSLAAPGSCKLFLVDDYPYYREIFDRLGLVDRIVTAPSKRVTIRSPQVLISSNIGPDFRHPAHGCAPWAIDYLRTAFGIKDRATGRRRRIVISRADARGRAVSNWEEILPVFRRRGFEVVVLAELAVESQMVLFRDASHVVGVHGAGLTNILFAPRNCAVLEILPPLVATRAYWLLASSLGQRYSALIADDPELPRPDYAVWRHDATNNGRDIVVPVDRLDAALAQM